MRYFSLSFEVNYELNPPYYSNGFTNLSIFEFLISIVEYQFHFNTDHFLIKSLPICCSNF